MDKKEKLQPFTYDLPRDRIAQRPVSPYDCAKLLVVDRATRDLYSTTFSDLPKVLSSHDLLIFNDTKVIPARLFGNRIDTGGKVELLLVEEISAGVWSCLGKPLKKLTAKVQITFGDTLVGTVQEGEKSNRIQVTFSSRDATQSVDQLLAVAGVMPIPPYIRNGVADKQDTVDYQTLWAKESGSIAAPTASLHFTEELLTAFDRREIRREVVTLHVGTPSFLPLNWDGNQEQFLPPGVERYSVELAVLERMRSTKKSEQRVIAVGTTTLRAVEAASSGTLAGQTDLFISPGYPFQLIDGLITNFHQSGTSHLLLVEALLGRELLKEVYSFAMENDFRFLSYGDGMLIL